LRSTLTLPGQPRPVPLWNLPDRKDLDRDAFRRVSKGRVSSTANARLFSGLKTSRASHTVLASESPPRASARRTGPSLASAAPLESSCDFPNVTTRDASDRLLPFHVFVPAPVPRRLLLRVERLRALVAQGIRLIQRQCNSLRCVARSLTGFVAVGVFLLTGRARTAPLTPLSPLSPGLSRSHATRLSRAAKNPIKLASRERNDPKRALGCLPSDENLRPATSFRTSGSGCPIPRDLATAGKVIDTFSPTETPCGSSGGQALVHADRCQRWSRFSEPRHRSPTSAT